MLTWESSETLTQLALAKKALATVKKKQAETGQLIYSEMKISIQGNKITQASR